MYIFHLFFKEYLQALDIYRQLNLSINLYLLEMEQINILHV